MSMKSPFVSVVIPTHNSEAYVADALKSVFSQTYDNFEVVVTDSGSTDRTKKIVKEILSRYQRAETRLLENAHSGPGKNRNHGILASRGEWVAFLDSDDLWHKDKLAKVAENIMKYPEVALWCHSEVMRVGKKETLLEHYKKFNPKIDPFLSIYRENSLSTSAVTVKKEALLKAGLFADDESFSHAEDFELWLRLARVAKIGYLKDVLGVYIVREGGVSSRPIRVFRALMGISRKYRGELQRTAKFFFLDDMRYRGRAFSTAGQGFLSQKRYVRGLFFLAVGILYWPYRPGFFKRLFTGPKRRMTSCERMSSADMQPE